MWNRLRKGQVSILGKSIPIFLLAVLLTGGTVAALLTVYITITGSATIAQSVVLDGWESTYKYEVVATEDTETLVAFNIPVEIAGGDEQHVGLLLSNYAQHEAPVYLEATVTGPDGGYEECMDLMITFWDDYWASDDTRCTGITDPVVCDGELHCYWDGSCKGDEHCDGAEIASTCTVDVTTSNSFNLPVRIDTGNPSETWVCVKHVWDIKAAPGSYGFETKVIPSTI